MPRFQRRLDELRLQIADERNTAVTKLDAAIEQRERSRRIA